MLTAGNDLSTRAHVADVLNRADDIEEYHDWLHANTSVEDESPVDSCPMIVSIENKLSDTIARQSTIAAKRGLTLDQYREDLADRVEHLRDNLIAHRKYGFDGRYGVYGFDD